ncbi:YbaB/EbfC family nucleoid-associated protein [Saccharothrix sp. S26]|uniref:YbaB/EbfC family nucleoid-associated protein n=1 Tax=Saccharothrix sp. S26 TaxID=2907215 RepID=UPI001F29224B|nr:YbaB/EbfC family nucleoid-associated protein [Saccharothrix sp. S26]MCE7000825.1 YbaB/EbfC family nucleoid-associated protein [Saccharothrix sp. S26]
MPTFPTEASAMDEVDYRQVADEVTGIQRKMADIRVVAESADGLVRVTVGARGELLGLLLDPRIYRNPDADALASTIAQTVRRAVRQAQEEVFVLVRRFLPADATPASTDLDFDPLLTALDRARGAVR